MTEDTAWRPFEDGSTLGGPGSQGGDITRDEEVPGRLRLTYESDASRDFHAVSCLVTGWLLHHRFFDSEEKALAAFEEMKPALVELQSQLHPGGPRTSAEGRAAGPLLARFQVRFS
ncbi:hypothetical protein JGU66_33075 [Myxococcaceae bacterium JPH2]|nr:hypothetical protein [Myxococcaceae bacterium JPH2]